jgi:hypothetical protein
MQTPVLEAFTSTNANINYGLTSHTRTDLLYLPVLKPNHQVSNNGAPTGSVYYLAANSETANKLRTYHSSSKYVLEQNQPADTMIFVESGLDTTNLVGDASNRSSYIVNMNLLDSVYNVYADGRFIAGLMAPRASAYFRNTSAGSADINMSPLRRVNATSATPVLENYRTYNAAGITNAVTYNSTIAATTISVIAGPRGTVTSMNFVVDNQLAATSGGARSIKYDKYGFYNKALFGGSDLFDYIDTTVYVEGGVSSGRIQLPLRIVRYAGT